MDTHEYILRSCSVSANQSVGRTWLLEREGIASMFSCARLFTTPWTVASQAPLSVGFSKQEYWSGLPFPSPGDLQTQELNLGLLPCTRILYRLSYEYKCSLIMYCLKTYLFFYKVSSDSTFGHF